MAWSGPIPHSSAGAGGVPGGLVSSCVVPISVRYPTRASAIPVTDRRDPVADLDYGPPDDDPALHAYIELMIDSLHEPGDPRAVADVARTFVADRANVRIVRSGRETASGLAYYDGGQWFGGRSVPSSAVAAVAVAPHHRGRGVGALLMRELVLELKKKGAAVSSLYPSTLTFYRRAGYELAGTHLEYQLPLRGLELMNGDRSREVDVRPMSDADMELVAAAYRSRMRGASGPFDRAPHLWSIALAKGRANVSRYVFEASGVCEGYAVVERRSDGRGSHDIHLVDHVALTGRALERLLTLVAGHRSTAQNLVFSGTAAEPLACALAEQAGLSIRRGPIGRCGSSTSSVRCRRGVTRRGFAASSTSSSPIPRARTRAAGCSSSTTALPSSDAADGATRASMCSVSHRSIRATSPRTNLVVSEGWTPTTTRSSVPLRSSRAPHRGYRTSSDGKHNPSHRGPPRRRSTWSVQLWSVRARHPDELRFVAVAEPNEQRRTRFAEAHGIPPSMQFSDWRELVARPKLAEVCLDTTQDQEHLASSLAAIEAGYDLLLEKPIATRAEESAAIVRAAEAKGRILEVCHVLRHTAFFASVHDIVASGRLGDLVTIDHRENVEYAHMT